MFATSVSNTSLTADVPDLSSAYSGSYQIRVTNKTSEGYYAHSVGTANVSAYGRDRLDSDGAGWYDDEDVILTILSGVPTVVVVLRIRWP